MDVPYKISSCPVFDPEYRDLLSNRLGLGTDEDIIGLSYFVSFVGGEPATSWDPTLWYFSSQSLKTTRFQHAPLSVIDRAAAAHFKRGSLLHGPSRLVLHEMERLGHAHHYTLLILRFGVVLAAQSITTTLAKTNLETSGLHADGALRVLLDGAPSSHEHLAAVAFLDPFLKSYLLDIEPRTTTSSILDLNDITLRGQIEA